MSLRHWHWSDMALKDFLSNTTVPFPGRQCREEQSTETLKHALTLALSIPKARTSADGCLRLREGSCLLLCEWASTQRKSLAHWASNHSLTDTFFVPVPDSCFCVFKKGCPPLAADISFEQNHAMLQFKIYYRDGLGIQLCDRVFT